MAVVIEHCSQLILLTPVFCILLLLSRLVVYITDKIAGCKLYIPTHAYENIVLGFLQRSLRIACVNLLKVIEKSLDFQF